MLQVRKARFTGPWIIAQGGPATKRGSEAVCRPQVYNHPLHLLAGNTSCWQEQPLCSKAASVMLEPELGLGQ